MATITIDVPDEMLESFDSLEEVRETIYEDFIIEQRQRGNISLGREAELLGISYAEFFYLLGKKGLSFINATPHDLNKNYQNFEKIMEQVRK